MKTYYLIDFENVGTGGFSGCELLGTGDFIHVFYTDQAKKFDLDILGRHKAESLVIHKVPVGNQSADMHITAYIGYLAGMNRGEEVSYVIVSKDTDFDNIIKFLMETAGAKITRSKTVKEISGSNKKESKKEVRTKSDKNAGKKNSSASENSTADRKMQLKKELQKPLKPVCSETSLDRVTEIVLKHYGEKSMLRSIHNELKNIYSDYDAKYNALKPVVKKHFTAPQKEIPENTELNSTIQKVLSKAKMKNDVINFTASLAVKYSGKDNSRASINRELVKKYGQVKGTDLYNRIKKYLKD